MSIVERAASKVPEVTLIFWIVKVAATTLGETAGDAVSMSMNLGYAVSSIIFIGLFAAAVAWQIAASSFRPFLYWAVIVATTTAGTTMADFADRSLGIGYAGGSLTLFALLMASLYVWYRSEGSLAVTTVTTPKVETFYWGAILFSQTLGTALGDWMADTNGFGYERGAGGGRGYLFLYERIAHAAVLECVHPDTAAWGNPRRSARQAPEQGRA